jgi:thymidylate synthase
MKNQHQFVYVEANADTAWRRTAIDILKYGEVIESRGGKTREIVPVLIQIADPCQAIVYGRPINPAFAISETIWNLCGGTRLDFVKFFNSRIDQFMENVNGVAQSAYGYRLGAQPSIFTDNAEFLGQASDKRRIDQVHYAYLALKEDQSSRQIIQQFWYSEIDMPAPTPKKSVPCVIARQYLIRDEKLDYFEIMRSNDLIFGMPHDIINATIHQQILAGWLGVEVGTYTHYATSLHVYERHWSLLDTVELAQQPIPVNQSDLRESYDDWQEFWPHLVRATVALTRAQAPQFFQEIYQDTAILPNAYQAWIAVLAAEALRRRKAKSEAFEMIKQAGEYWEQSWLLWTNSLGRNRRKAA